MAEFYQQFGRIYCTRRLHMFHKLSQIFQQMVYIKQGLHQTSQSKNINT